MNGTGADAEVSVNTLFQDGLGTRPDRSGNGQGWTSQRVRQAGHTDGCLAEGALTIQSALTGETQVCGMQALAQVHGLDDEVDPTLEPSPGERHQPPT